VLDVQVRGEYLYAAMGREGFRVFDVANVDNKNFSEKMTSAPVSPLGQKFYLRTKNATGVGSPSTQAVDPLRTRLPENEEQPPALMYGFLYVTDSEEGLIVVGDPNLKSKSPGVLTLLDGDPRNNFLKRAATFNPSGALTGARRITIAGHYAYIATAKAVVVVDIENPVAPKITAQLPMNDPRGIAVQFRYAFVTTRTGLEVLDVTTLANPKLVAGAQVRLEDAQNLYVARTYAYVAGGKQGLVIIDVEAPERPKLAQVFNAGGELKDTRDVKLGMTAASAFAYIADGEAGFKVVQIFAPNDNPNYQGFSPIPTPKLIAKRHTHGPALAVSKGIDRDRAVDESGNQVSVFNRRGSRPFNRTEAERMFLRNGQVYTVTDAPPNAPR
jgi:LVIVD repeat